MKPEPAEDEAPTWQAQRVPAPGGRGDQSDAPGRFPKFTAFSLLRVNKPKSPIFFFHTTFFPTNPGSGKLLFSGPKVVSNRSAYFSKNLIGFPPTP